MASPVRFDTWELTGPDLDPEPALDSRAIRQSVVHHVRRTQGKHPAAATPRDNFVAVASAARERLFELWARTAQRRLIQKPKRVY